MNNLRLDGTPKSMHGFLGAIPSLINSGSVMTEYSIGTPGSNELFRPAIVPTLTSDEIAMIQNGIINEEIARKSYYHAMMRQRLGRPIFFEDTEIPELALADQFITQGSVPRGLLGSTLTTDEAKKILGLLTNGE
jgi:hypothetical protein